MNYPVRITRSALRDLEEIYDWIACNDAPAKAEHVLDQLSKAAQSISNMPERGSRPRELPAGMDNFRQIYFKPYRVIYRIGATEVVIHLIVDGRRNLQTLLLRRLTED
jgi:toxin ParE1/3/4